MSKKRGQISIFIILGIIVIVIISVLLYQRRAGVEEPELKAPVDVASTQVFVEQCLMRVGEEGIIHNSLQGGYYQNFDQLALPVVGFYKAPVYFDSATSTIPTEEKLKEELENYVRDKLPECTENFETVKGINVAEQGNVSIKSMLLGEKAVTIEYDYPLLVNGKTELSKFVVDYDFRLGTVYNVAKSLVQESEKEPEFLCLSCFITAGMENDLLFSNLDRGNYQIIIIKDETTKTPLNFAYAIKLLGPTEIGAS